MASAKFKKLENAVAREYEKKGMSKRRATYIGRAVAGKVAHLKAQKRLAKKTGKALKRFGRKVWKRPLL